MRTIRTAVVSALCAAAVALGGCSPSFDAASQSDPYARPVGGGQASMRSASAATAAASVASSTDPEVAGLARGSGTVRALMLGHGDTSVVATRFQQATGYTVDWVTPGKDDTGVSGNAGSSQSAGDGSQDGAPSGAREVAVLQPVNATQLDDVDVVVGADQFDLDAWGSAVEDAVTVGRVDVCVMADHQWFAANKQKVPATWDDIAAMANQLMLPAANTMVSRYFENGASQAKGGGFVTSLKNNGARVDSGDGWLAFSGFQAVAHGPQTGTVGGGTGGTSGDARPLIVAEQVPLTVQTLTNTQAESAATPVADTCLKREVSAAMTQRGRDTDAAQSLLDFLRTAAGQRALADAGVAYPAQASSVEDPATLLAQPVKDARDVAVK